MAFPLTGQGFIVKPLDGAQTLRPGKPGNVLPFLVTLQNFDGDWAGKLFVDATVLFDLPHATLCIYHKWYVKRDDGMVMHNEAVERLFSSAHPAAKPMGHQGIGQELLRRRVHGPLQAHDGPSISAPQAVARIYQASAPGILCLFKATVP